MTDNDRRAVLHGVAAVALWSTVATAFKFSLDYLTPLSLVTVAASVSWLFFGAMLLITGRWRGLRRLSPGQCSAGLATGLLNPAAYYLILFAAYARLPAQEAMALNYTWALTLPLLAAPLLGQRLSRRELLAASVSYVGVFVIAIRGQVFSLEFADPVGVLLALASTVVWALCWIANTRQKLDPVTGLFLNFTAATPLLLVLSATQDSTGSLPLPGILGGVYIGFFEMGLSFVLWLTAMQLTSSTARISTLIFLSPPVSLMIIWLVLGEPILPSTIAGLALILIGLYFQHSAPRQGA